MTVYCILYIITYSLSMCTSIYFPSEHIILVRERLKLSTQQSGIGRKRGEQFACNPWARDYINCYIRGERCTYFAVSYYAFIRKLTKPIGFPIFVILQKEEVLIIFMASASSHPPVWTFFLRVEKRDWASILARTHQHSSIKVYLVLNRCESSSNSQSNYSFS